MEERSDFAAFLDALPGPYLVIENDAGEVVAGGGHAVAPGTRTADLCWGMARRDLHGTGLGRRLLDERLKRVMADEQATSVRLQTSQHTRGFYERRGFICVDVIPDAFGPGLDHCEMRLRLPPRRPRF